MLMFGKICLKIPLALCVYCTAGWMTYRNGVGVHGGREIGAEFFHRYFVRLGDYRRALRVRGWGLRGRGGGGGWWPGFERF